MIEKLGDLWPFANPEERHEILAGMVEAVYVDLADTKKVVGLAPKPAFKKLFDVVTTESDSGVIILTPPREPRTNSAEQGSERNNNWLCWRRGGPQTRP